MHTTFLIPNLHCPTCASQIEWTLSTLRPVPSSVRVSIVSHAVTVTHQRSLAVVTIAQALDDAGYEIFDLIPDPTSSRPDLPPNLQRGLEPPSFEHALSRWRSHPSEVDVGKRRRHLENCQQCQTISRSSTEETESLSLVVDHLPDIPKQFKANFMVEGMTCSSCVGTITRTLNERVWVRSADVSLITHSAMVVFEGNDAQHRVKELTDAIEDVGYTASLDGVQEYFASRPSNKSPPADLWHATYAIDGMTCNSCVGNITRAIQDLDYVSKVDVSLINHVASVHFAGKDHVDDIANAIQGVGYDVRLDTLSTAESTPETRSDRTVSIRIDGMHCGQCPERVTQSMKRMKSVTIETLPTLQDPILTVSYTPDPPHLTVRALLSAVSDIDPSFDVSIHHPPTLEERSRKMMAREQRYILYRVSLSIVVTIPTFIIGIVYMNLVPHDNLGYKYLMTELAGVTRAEWANFVMATPVYFFAADIFHRRTYRELRALWRPGSQVPLLRRFYRFGSMNMLVSFGTSIAYFASVAELIIATTRTSAMPADGSMQRNGPGASYFDSVVFLTMFLLIGRYIEAYMKAQAGDAVAALAKLKSAEALLVSTDSTTGHPSTSPVHVDLIEAGDIVRVVNGSSPPCDGVVLEGESKFDESSLTGESMPVKKDVGAPVYSGTINKVAPVTIRITGVAGKSMLDSIIEVVREGQTKRAPVERVADLLTGYFVPFVVLLVIITWIIWLSLGESGVLPSSYRDTDIGGWPFWSLQFAIAVFVIACPCGLGLAAPTALFVGGGLAAKLGILVKGGGEAFQEASALDCIVFDKTGTLTEGGEPKVTDFEVFVSNNDSLDESDVLGVLKRLEEDSSHPLAKAAVAFCVSRTFANFEAEKVEEIGGKGMRGLVFAGSQPQRKIRALVGNEALMSDNNIVLASETQEKLDSWKMQGKSVILVATAGTSDHDGGLRPFSLSAIAATSDPLRSESIQVVKSLRKRGIDVWMISGDNEKTARAVASKVGIETTNVIAGVLPEQKAEKIQYLQKAVPKNGARSHTVVAMVGDGINDSPALTMADVGIAIGSGSEVAISSADFVLVSSNLVSLLVLIDLSRTVFKRIKFNFFWAALYNMIALPIAAGALYPIQSGGAHVRLDPVWAALAMALSSISVVTSSLLLRTRLPVLGFRAAKERDLLEKEN
jgi:Cu+-exporting ATPase